MAVNYQTSAAVKYESRGEATDTSKGTLVTATTANTKSAWTNLGATTQFDYEQLIVCLGAGTAQALDFAVDIGIGTGTGTWVLVQDLHVDSTRSPGFGSLQISLPLHVPKGSQLGIRVSANAASGNINALLIGSSAGMRGMPGYARCFAISTATLSRGITVQSTATANDLGNYAILTSAMPRKADAIFGLFGMNGDSTKALVMSWLMDIGIGTATAAPNPIVQNYYVNTETSLAVLFDRKTPFFPVSLATGDAVHVRFRCNSSATADNALDFMLYGLEP